MYVSMCLFRSNYALLAILRSTLFTRVHYCLKYIKCHFPGSWEDFYVDYDWTELPVQRSDNENVKAAAKDLGFNKTTWDTNLTISTDYLDWANLTTPEQEAAMILGYDECTWDRETLDGTM